MLPLRVLVVDDEELLRMGIARLVEQAGDMYKVIGICASGREALDVLKTEEADLIITDIRMPEMSGLELLTEAKSLYPDLFSLIISGYEEFDYARSALKLGASDYILKPIDRKQFRELLLTIRDMIVNYRKRKFLQRDLDNQFKKTNNLQMENFLNSVLYASRLPHTSEWDQLLIDPHCRYRLIAASIDRNQRSSGHYSERDYELLEYAMNGIMNDVCLEWASLHHNYKFVHYWKGMDGLGWFLVMKPRHTDMEPDSSEKAKVGRPLETLCEQIIERVQEIFLRYLPVSVSLGVSNELEDMATISQAAAEAKATLQRRLFEGGGKCFWMDKHSAARTETINEGKHLFKRAHELENRLLNVVRAFDDASIRATVEELFALWNQSGIPSSNVPAYVLSLMLRANIFIDEIRLEARELEKSMSIGYMESVWRRMQAVADVLELKEELLRFLLYVSGKLRSLRIGSDKEPIDKAKEYIERHLSEDLTLSNVAGKVYLNPSYFSNLFKVQTGENFLNYVTRIRMEKAQQMLRQRDLKLNEIAAKIGYQNPKYFTKLFKEFSGVTPTEFRELL